MKNLPLYTTAMALALSTLFSAQALAVKPSDGRDATPYQPAPHGPNEEMDALNPFKRQKSISTPPKNTNLSKVTRRNAIKKSRPSSTGLIDSDLVNDPASGPLENWVTLPEDQAKRSSSRTNSIRRSNSQSNGSSMIDNGTGVLMIGGDPSRRASTRSPKLIDPDELDTENDPRLTGPDRDNLLFEATNEPSLTGPDRDNLLFEATNEPSTGPDRDNLLFEATNSVNSRRKLQHQAPIDEDPEFVHYADEHQEPYQNFVTRESDVVGVRRSY
jgi:hypothetical protein